MSTINYRITLDLGAKMELSAGINAALLPLVNQAVRGIAQATEANWREAVLHAKLWSGEKDAYAGSISHRMTGDFSAMVEADYKYAQEIETGRPARDLKKMLDTSLKVRRTEDGRRFLVIPFRHNTPGNNAHAKAMPKAVHGLAEAMDASSVTSSWRKRRTGEVTHLSPNTGMHASSRQSPFLSRTDTKTAMTTRKLTYSWGGRLTAQMLKGAGADKETVRRYSGMVKMDTGANGQKSSSYMTFRMMMEGSKGWIVPAQPGQYIAQKVAQNMQPKAKSAIEAAIKKTLG